MSVGHINPDAVQHSDTAAAGSELPKVQSHRVVTDTPASASQSRQALPLLPLRRRSELFNSSPLSTTVISEDDASTAVNQSGASAQDVLVNLEASGAFRLDDVLFQTDMVAASGDKDTLQKLHSFPVLFSRGDLHEAAGATVGLHSRESTLDVSHMYVTRLV